MIKCPKCGYEWDDNFKYCKNCGTNLHNYCSNPDCSCNENNINPVEFLPEDCFCDECGSKTTFYEQGLIQPHIK